jgi:hypothetical protein
MARASTSTGKTPSQKTAAKSATANARSSKSASAIKGSRKSTLPSRPALSQEYIVDSDSDLSEREDEKNKSVPRAKPLTARN